jgi:hypothetical protein
MASDARDDVNLDNGRDSAAADRALIRDPLDSG